MSIILRALKKVQNQREEPPPPVSAEEAAELKEAGTDTNMPPPSPPMAAEDTARFDDISTLAADGGEEQEDPVLTPAGEVRHGFGLGPKTLLGLLLILGIFTTGWFASKIYLSLNSGGAATKADSSAGAKQPLKHMRAARAPLPPAEPAPPAEPPPAQQPVPAGAVVVVEPPRAEPRAPAVEEPPAPVQASAPLDVAPPQPLASSVKVEAAPVVISEVEPAMSEPEPPPPSVAKQYLRQTKSVVPEPAPPAEKESLPVKKGRPELKINAIAWKAKEPKAIVNMQRVRVGDVIEGAKVLAIKKKIIFFEYDGEFFEVRF